MEEKHRLSREEIDRRHPDLIPALRTHPHVGWLLVRSEEHGPVVLGADGAHMPAEGRVEGSDPLAPFSPTAARHIARTDGFSNAPDILVGSFYDPMVDEGCAFEELISFHGGLGGPQTRPFILAPPGLSVAGRADHRCRCRARAAERLAAAAARGPRRSPGSDDARRRDGAYDSAP